MHSMLMGVFLHALMLLTLLPNLMHVAHARREPEAREPERIYRSESDLSSGCHEDTIAALHSVRPMTVESSLHVPQQPSVPHLRDVLDS